MDEFDLNLELSLKRSVMMLIAQILWKSQDVKKKISELIRQDKLKLPKNKFRFSDNGRLAKNMSDDNFYFWEEIIGSVLEKTDSLLLPCGVESDLREVIILMGEKIFYFYDEYKEADEAGVVFWNHVRCRKCIDAAKTEHFYSFLNYGIAEFKCSTLHFENVPEKDSEKFKEFLDDACRHSNLEIVEKYQNDVIAYLESLQPGLNIKSKKDVIFNIICIYNFIQYEETWKRRYRPEYNDNGYIKIPNHYLNNADFIIPLEVVPQMTISACPQTFRYLATKLHEYNDQSSQFSKMAKIQIDFEQASVLNKHLHFYPNPDFGSGRMLITLMLMSATEKAHFIESNLKYLLLYFLPVWPFRELVSNILDVCIKKKFDLNDRFLLDFISVCVGNVNKSKYKVQKQIFVKAFQKIWHETSKETKLIFLASKTKFLLMEDKDCQIVKELIFKNEYFENPELVILKNKWNEILEKKNFLSVNKFLNEVVFNGGLLINELDHFLKDYNKQKFLRAVICYKDFIV